MMKIINIGGAINSGKSTVCKIIAQELDNSIFIEVDDLLSDRDGQLFGSFSERINERLRRLYDELKIHLKSKQYEYIIFAYPMSERTYRQVSMLAEEQARFVVITLNPSLTKCLENRGTRELCAWEINRIKEMYQQGFNIFAKSDLILDNGDEPATQTAAKIIKFITQI